MLFLRNKWAEFHNKKKQSLNVKHDMNFGVGNLVTYNLSDEEKQKYKHSSGCNQLILRKSFPYRVKDVKNGTLIVVAVYFKGEAAQIRIAKVKPLKMRQD